MNRDTLHYSQGNTNQLWIKTYSIIHKKITNQLWMDTHSIIHSNTPPFVDRDLLNYP